MWTSKALPRDCKFQSYWICKGSTARVWSVFSCCRDNVFLSGCYLCAEMLNPSVCPWPAAVGTGWTVCTGWACPHCCTEHAWAPDGWRWANQSHPLAPGIEHCDRKSLSQRNAGTMVTLCPSWSRGSCSVYSKIIVGREFCWIPTGFPVPGSRYCRERSILLNSYEKFIFFLIFTLPSSEGILTWN